MRQWSHLQWGRSARGPQVREQAVLWALLMGQAQGNPQAAQQGRRKAGQQGPLGLPVQPRFPHVQWVAVAIKFHRVGVWKKLLSNN